MSTPKFCYVIDVEATCWDDVTPGGDDSVSDIIEIGITRILMPDKVMVDSKAIIVKPTNSEISEFCTKLTTLTPKYVDTFGVSFADAIEMLRGPEYKVHRNMWASWGDYDKNIFQRQCKREGIRYPFNNNHLNVKSLFCWKYGSNMGLGKAIPYMNMDFDGTAHRGIDDSINIAKILLKL